MSSAEANAVLTVQHVSKRFGGVLALDDVSLVVRAGEIHGLLGENGSGKSTLIKILAGYHVPEPGAELELGRRPVRLPLVPGQSRTLGLSFVHQDLALIRSLSVTENLRLTNLATRRGRPISWRREREHAREALARLDTQLDERAAVGDLPPAGQALVAIARALADLEAKGSPGRLLVLDEPTVFLPEPDVARLFTALRAVVRSGSSVLFVSHDLSEVLDLTDRMTVLRDGRNVGTVRTADVTGDDLVGMVVGRLVDEPRASVPDVRPAGAVAVRELEGRSVGPLSFEVAGGEILGLTGLEGSGFEEVPYLVFGARRAIAGRIELGGSSHSLADMSPARAARIGMSLLPGDRQRGGGVGSLSLADNLMLPVLDSYRRGPLLERRRMTGDSASLLVRFGVRPNEPGLAFDALSGGNQQKVALAKVLNTRPRLLLLVEPTRGVDVGARRQIFATIRAAAAAGTAVLCASSDHEELAALCDRVLVLAAGRMTGRLEGAAVTSEGVARACHSRAATETSVPVAS